MSRGRRRTRDVPGEAVRLGECAWRAPGGLTWGERKRIEREFSAQRILAGRKPTPAIDFRETEEG